MLAPGNVRQCNLVCVGWGAMGGGYMCVTGGVSEPPPPVPTACSISILLDLNTGHDTPDDGRRGTGAAATLRRAVFPCARPPADRYEPFTHGRVRASEKIDLLPRVVAVALVRRDAG
jgi:hypothetical protein